MFHSLKLEETLLGLIMKDEEGEITGVLSPADETNEVLLHLPLYLSQQGV